MMQITPGYCNARLWFHAVISRDLSVILPGHPVPYLERCYGRLLRTCTLVIYGKTLQKNFIIFLMTDVGGAHAGSLGNCN